MINTSFEKMSVEAKYSRWTKVSFTAFAVVFSCFMIYAAIYTSESIAQALAFAFVPPILTVVTIDACLFKIIVEEGRVVRDGVIRKEIKFKRLRNFENTEKRLILRSGSGPLQYIYVSKDLSGYKDVEKTILSQVNRD